MFTMIFLLLFIVSKLSINEEKRKKIFLIISFIPLFIISAARGINVGTDTMNYLQGYNTIAIHEFANVFSVLRWENGYVLINKLTSLVTTNAQGIIVVTSFLTLFTILLTISKHSKNIIFSIYLYITFYHYFAAFNLIRQYLAIGVLMLAYDQLLKRNFVKYSTLVLIASSFHQLAILLLPIYFLYGIRINKKKLILIASVFSITVVFFDRILALSFELFPMYEMYLGTDYFREGGLLTSLISGALVAFALFIKFTNNTDKEFDFLLVLAILAMLSSVLSMNITLLNRLSYYFSIYYILFIPKALSVVKDVKLRSLYFIMISFATGGYFIFRLIDNWHRIAPYTLFFNN